MRSFRKGLFLFVFCDCSFQWKFADGDAHGVSIGKTLPAYPTETEHIYPNEAFTAENAAKIPCNQVLGTGTQQLLPPEYPD